eukprot:tig00001187_g7461.t1
MAPEIPGFVYDEATKRYYKAPANPRAALLQLSKRARASAATASSRSSTASAAPPAPAETGVRRARSMTRELAAREVDVSCCSRRRLKDCAVASAFAAAPVLRFPDALGDSRGAWNAVGPQEFNRHDADIDVHPSLPFVATGGSAGSLSLFEVIDLEGAPGPSEDPPRGFFRGEGGAGVAAPAPPALRLCLRSQATSSVCTPVSSLRWGAGLVAHGDAVLATTELGGASSSGSAVVWRVGQANGALGPEAPTLSAQASFGKASAWSCAWQPGPPSLLAVGADGVYAWDLTSGRTRRLQPAPAPPAPGAGRRSDVFALAFSDANTVLSGDRSGAVLTWDLRAGPREARAQSHAPPLLDGPDPPTPARGRVARSSVCSLRPLASAPHAVLVSATSHQLLLLDRRRPGAGARLEGHRNECTTTLRAALDPSEAYAACGGDDGRLRVWCLPSGRLLASCPPPAVDVEEEGGPRPVCSLAWQRPPHCAGPPAAAWGTHTRGVLGLGRQS